MADLEKSGELSAIEDVAGRVQISEPHLGQTLNCGPWTVVVDFNWSNLIVDKYELVNIPRAVSWLAGAVNIEGAIFPVVDLATYIVGPVVEVPANGKNVRLLLGGRSEGASDEAVGLLFTGLPFQIEYSRQPIDAEAPIPLRLREICRGMAIAADGQRYFELDTDRLLNWLTMNLVES
jgi:chemotaxis signal transduction protein